MTETPDLGPSSPIAAALVALQLDLPTIAKAESATVKSDKGQYSYKYAGLVAVAQAVYPRLAALGLAFTSFPTLNDAGRFVLRYSLLHTSGEERSGDFPLANDYKTPQALGSAITYARRYALCAVTGVAPEDDDGQAAAYTEQQNTAPASPPVDNEATQAINSLIGVWQLQFGPWSPAAQAEAGREFKQWSGGEEIRSAPPARLRAFTAYLSTLNPKEAGDPPPTEQQYRNPDAELSEAQRARILAGLTELGIKERQARLAWMTRELGRTVESTNDLTMAEAGQVIEALNRGVDVPQGGAQ